jgi:ribosomal protein S26
MISAKVWQIVVIMEAAAASDVNMVLVLADNLSITHICVSCQVGKGLVVLKRKRRKEKK